MRVLLIEEKENIARLIQKNLKNEGYAVDLKTDGETGQRWLVTHHNDYDVVIMNRFLPTRDGVEICKNLREKNITVPVLMLGQTNSVEEKVFSLDMGADDFLEIPISFEELKARIRNLLRRPYFKLPSELKVKNLVLNPSTRQVFIGHREITLSLKEFALLEYLVRHANQAVNREQLLAHVWDDSFDSFSNVVDVHVKNLRKKLQQTGLLETVHGIGYRIKG